MKKKIICFILTGIMMVNVLACDKARLSNSTEDLTESYKKTGTSEVQMEDTLSTEYKKEFEENYADFAIELLKNTAESGESCMISPLSLLTSLTMTENGADGETLSQMEQVLANGTSVERQCQELVDFSYNLPDAEGSQLKQANSIWFKEEDTDKDSWVKETFLQKNADTFQADIFGSFFNNDTIEDINVWVSNETDGMVPQMLEKMSEDAVMYLINAVAFEAEWENVYKASDIHDAEFLQENGTSQKVSMMYSDERQYLEDENTMGFMKTYKDGYSFVALLPSEEIALEEYLAGMSGEKWLNLMENVDNEEMVRTGIPKFKVEYENDMSEVLADMGMPLAFDNVQADFSGITEEQLSISRVLHKTYVNVDELGTKAGASTVVEMTKGEGAEVTKEVILNHPFIYAIIDNNTNLPVFLGIVEEIKEQ